MMCRDLKEENDELRGYCDLYAVQVRELQNELKTMRAAVIVLEAERNEARANVDRLQKTQYELEAAIIRTSDQLCDWQTRAIEAERKIKEATNA